MAAQWVVAAPASGIVGSADAPGTPSGLARVGESDPQLPSLVRAYCGATLAWTPRPQYVVAFCALPYAEQVG